MSQMPPHNLEAEQAVLGAVLCENSALFELLPLLSAADFYRGAHQKIFRAMVDLVEKSDPVDLITLSDDLQAKGELDAIGGTAYLAELGGLVPSIANIGAYSTRVKEAAMRRQGLELIRDAEAELREGGDEASEILSRLGSGIVNIQYGDGRKRGIASIREVMINTVNSVSRACDENEPVGVPIGLKDVDDRTGGLHRKDLVVVGGRTSVGKSAFGQTLAKGPAERGYSSLIVSLEMPAEQIGIRLLSEATRVENRKIRHGRLSDREIARVVEEAGTLGALPIYFLEGERRWTRIKSYLRGLKLKDNKLSVAVLDYAQLITARESAQEQRYIEIGRISSEAKMLAIELDICVVLLAQLNRKIEERTDKKPQLSDLRESGSLEQDSDVVMLLYEDDENSEAIKISIAKDRSGATGSIRLRFDRPTTSLSDWDPDPQASAQERGEKMFA